MLFVSNPESAKVGHISVLAVLESLAAITVSVWIAIEYQTVRHIVIGGCVAPFLLLRTEQSTSLAISWFSAVDRIWDSYDRWDASTHGIVKALSAIVQILLVFPLIIVAVNLLRVIGTIAVVIQHPVVSLRAIPVNWRRITLATDICRYPEVIPGIETTPVTSVNLNEMKFSRFLGMFKPQWTPVDIPLGLTTFHKWFWRLLTYSVAWVIDAWFMILLGSIIYIPSFTYRFSVKSTSIIYGPLIWIINSHLGETASTEEQLVDILEGESEQLQRWYAWVMIISTVISFVIAGGSTTVLYSVYTNSGDIGKLVFSVFLPTDGFNLHVNGWHVARFVNAVISIWLFLYADKAIRRLQSGAWQGSHVQRVLDSCQAVKACLAAYIIACSLTAFLKFGIWRTLPSIEFHLFP